MRHLVLVILYVWLTDMDTRLYRDAWLNKLTEIKHNVNEVRSFAPIMYRKLAHRLNNCGYRALFKRT